MWVILCMAAGVLIGRFFPAIPEFLDSLSLAGISIPIAILIWVMIYPMMMKVDFQSIKPVGKNPKGLISPELATQYLAGAVLLGAAPCTAMVFVWSTLTNGNPAYTVVQVATNDLIILVTFVPIVKFLLGVSDVTVPYSPLFLSVFLFVVIPLAGGMLTRVGIIKSRGQEYFEHIFIHKFDYATTVGLLLTLIILFASQTEVILSNPLHIVLIAVPLIIQTFLIFAIALFGTTSPAALATTVGVLTEVPVMLLLVKIANRTKNWFPENSPGNKPKVAFVCVHNSGRSPHDEKIVWN